MAKPTKKKTGRENKDEIDEPPIFSYATKEKTVNATPVEENEK